MVRPLPRAGTFAKHLVSVESAIPLFRSLYDDRSSPCQSVAERLPHMHEKRFAGFASIDYSRVFKSMNPLRRPPKPTYSRRVGLMRFRDTAAIASTIVNVSQVSAAFVNGSLYEEDNNRE